ncbi:hypothetical protein [Serratia phage vB_SmaS_Opt-169]|nr:hypothetical protein [Serratia phage vB_SmaS_Opt-169]
MSTLKSYRQKKTPGNFLGLSGGLPSAQQGARSKAITA